MVGKEGALWAGVGGNCSIGMDVSDTITKQCPERGFFFMVGGAFRQEEARGKKAPGGGGESYQEV